MRFAEIICVKKSAEPIQSVDDNLSSHDLPKKQANPCFQQILPKSHDLQKQLK